MTSPPHTPEHNGLAERRHRHIVETGLALLSHASMPRSFWSFAFAAAVYLINRMPNRSIDFQLPYQKLFGQQPNLQRLRVFGCLCFPWLKPYTNNKLDEKSSPCVFLGYSLSQSAYFCLDRSTNRIYVSRHVTFHESSFPFSKPVTSINHESVTNVESFSNQFPSVTVIPQVHTPSPVQPTSPIVSPQIPPGPEIFEPDPTTIPAPTRVTATGSGPATSPPHDRAATGSIAADSSSPRHAPVPIVDQPPELVSSTQPASPSSDSSAPSNPSATSSSSQSSPTNTPAPPPPPVVLPPPPQVVAAPPAPTRCSSRPTRPVRRLNLHASAQISPDYVPSSVAEALIPY